MRYGIALLAFVLFVNFAQGQTVFWTETFSAGSTARATLAHNYPADIFGNWTQTELGSQANANQWYVSGEECGTPAGLCGSSCPNANASLHVSAIGGLCGTPDCGAAYDATNASNITHRRIESPVIDCSNYQSISVSFDYIAAQGDLPNDQVKVVYSCNGGTTWQDMPGGSPLPASPCCLCSDPFLCLFANICCGGVGACSGLDQGQWTNINIPLPACANNNPSFRFGFTWQNDGNGSGTDPSFAVDDIELRYDFFLANTEISFEGELFGNFIYLHAQASNQLHPASYILEKEVNGAFIQLAKKELAPGEIFESPDPRPFPGPNVYRLRLLNESGEILGQEWLEIHFAVKNQLSVILSPQPLAAGDPLTLYFSPKITEAFRCEIYDLKGAKLASITQAAEREMISLKLPTGQLRAGMYLLRMSALGGGFSLTKRFIVR